MKYAAALSMAVAPLAIAKAVHNVYPAHRRSSHLSELEGAAGIELGGLAGIEAVSSTQIIIIWANPGNNAATTTLNQQVTVTQTVTAGASSAAAAAIATHSVTVGGAAGLVYTPDQVAANVGDMVVFTFESTNHTVTQSSFGTPCTAMDGGMDSGFMPNPDNSVSPAPQVAMQVMTTGPLWFYCKQTGHCGKGMAMSINPTASKTQALFQAAAIAQKGAGAGSAITGNSTSSAGSAGSAGESAAASAVASASSAAAAVGTAISTGTGAIQTGACVCAVTCGSGSFPAVNAQGVANFGGFAGSLPASMMEAAI
ncbi:Uu.00g071970.m01.CDS01 [Anthostomella pinea]|uniref:Uu.00g071970.m01.CDS01 n=1 Tax=Anthostomella pinea TaxID=933095 RepID=A0AAI8VV02_9PEZI|nr:Uu.00g071970.m01.CDS01 [Anthostomella pinea]